MQPATPSFRRLQVEGWRQIDSVDLELHPQLTIITGANGAGKSTLLGLLSRHFGWHRHYLSTPVIGKSGVIEYTTSYFMSFLQRLRQQKQNVTDVGSLTYSNSAEALLQVPYAAGIQYDVSITNQQPVTGLHIDSHRPAPLYQTVTQIPTNAVTAQMAYVNYDNEMKSRYQGGYTNLQPMYRMKEAIISMATFGEGNSVVQGNESLLLAYRGFIDVLQKVLPESLGFLDLSIRMPEVVLITRSGEFALDAASGGIMTLIDVTWRMYMFSLDKISFVVTMDEPENHLHPTMQRSLMRRLMAAFPNAQFIVATHSPFVVSSVKDSSVYVLRYADRHGATEQLIPTAASRVVSERLDTVNKAGNASEILREVLGVNSTMPEWVVDGLDRIVARFRSKPFTNETLRELRAELAAVGYDELYPDALGALAKGR